MQLINEIVPKKILDKFNLTSAYLLYFGGGHFIIIMTNIEKYQKELDEIYDILINNLFVSHKGKLGIVFGKLAISYREFFDKNFSLSLEKLGEITALEKKRKFSTILNEAFF